jgi:hypothetical protein
MSIGGILLLLVVTALTIVIVVLPLLMNPRRPKVQTTTSDLVAEREAILNAVRDLDFDYQTGKLVESDYRMQRDLLVRRGADVLRRIDQQNQQNQVQNAPPDQAQNQQVAERSTAAQ